MNITSNTPPLIRAAMLTVAADEFDPLIFDLVLDAALAQTADLDDDNDTNGDRP